ncbi:MAG: gluconate 2-dehydrogenase subunit 3 family protein [Gammaproteobacteria bacterium]|nr:gluconate 2-dehydrogenase subunit 3 family protein [Gammaproteobacteria bacterium]
MKRRFFLKYSLAGMISTWAGSASTASISLGQPINHNPQQNTLRAFIDVLLPEDETPSASQLGIDEEILTRVANHPNYTRLLHGGLAWLDKMAYAQYNRRGFTLLTQAQREAIVRMAEATKMPSAQRLFFEQIRKDSFLFYYSHPQSWSNLGFNGPPQPAGFIDYTQAPDSNTL